VYTYWTRLPNAQFKISKGIYFGFSFTNSLLHSQSLACTRYIAIKQQYVPHTNTNFPAMIYICGSILSIMEKILQNIMEEYWSIGKISSELGRGLGKKYSPIREDWSCNRAEMGLERETMRWWGGEWEIIQRWERGVWRWP